MAEIDIAEYSMSRGKDLFPEDWMHRFAASITPTINQEKDFAQEIDEALSLLSHIVSQFMVIEGGIKGLFPIINQDGMFHAVPPPEGWTDQFNELVESFKVEMEKLQESEQHPS